MVTVVWVSSCLLESDKALFRVFFASLSVHKDDSRIILSRDSWVPLSEIWNSVHLWWGAGIWLFKQLSSVIQNGLGGQYSTQPLSHKSQWGPGLSVFDNMSWLQVVTLPLCSHLTSDSFLLTSILLSVQLEQCFKLCSMGPAVVPHCVTTALIHLVNIHRTAAICWALGSTLVLFTEVMINYHYERHFQREEPEEMREPTKMTSTVLRTLYLGCHFSIPRTETTGLGDL